MANTRDLSEDIEKALNNNMGIEIHKKKYYESLSEEEKKEYLEAKKITDKQRETLRDYKGYYEELPSSRGGKNKLASVWNAVMSIRRLGLFLKQRGVIDYKEAKKEDILAYVKSMSNSSDHSRSRAMTYIRMFYKWLYGIKDKYKYPEVVDDPRLVPEKTKNKKKPQDLLTQAEIKKLIDVGRNNRNRAIIMLSIGEGGMRSGEIGSLNISSVEFDERGVKVWIEKSKSKERYVRLVKSEPYLREYINKEYILDKSNPVNPLFYGDAGRVYKQRLRGYAFTQLLKRLAKNSGIKKRIYTHLGRAINISILTKKGMSAEISARRFGITAGTLRNVYLTIDDKDVDEAYLKIEGKLTLEEKNRIKEEEDLLSPKVCPRCNIKLPANSLYCNCGMILDQKEAMKVQDSQEKFMELLKKLNKISPESMIKFVDVMTRLDDEGKKGIKK